MTSTPRGRRPSSTTYSGGGAATTTGVAWTVSKLPWTDRGPRNGNSRDRKPPSNVSSTSTSYCRTTSDIESAAISSNAWLNVINDGRRLCNERQQNYLNSETDLGRGQTHCMPITTPKRAGVYFARLSWKRSLTDPRNGGGRLGELSTLTLTYIRLNFNIPCEHAFNISRLKLMETNAKT